MSIDAKHQKKRLGGLKIQLLKLNVWFLSQGGGYDVFMISIE